MKYKDKCLDHIDSIERVNKEVMTLIQEAIVTNNMASLNRCVTLLGNNENKFIEYLRNMIELEENPPF
tara:strand:+ start:355 stop:558 length:204 start_codon:yes stop_codon:yes gene_type:complete